MTYRWDDALDDRPRAGLAVRTVFCPDCGAAVTAAADWSVFPYTGLPFTRYREVLGAFGLHAAAPATRSCTTVVGGGSAPLG